MKISNTVLLPILIPFRRNNKWGFVDFEGNLKIDCLFNYVQHFADGLAPVNMYDKWGYINEYGEIAINIQFESASVFSEGLAVVSQYGKYGFIDKSGSNVIPCLFESLNNFSDERAAFKQSGKYGYLDKHGRIVIEAQFETVNNFSNQKALVETTTETYLIDKNGVRVEYFPEYIHDSHLSDEDNPIPFCANDKFGYATKKGKEIYPAIFKEAMNFSEGYALAQYHDKWGVINSSGIAQIDFLYDIIEPVIYHIEGKDYTFGFLIDNGKGFFDNNFVETIPYGKYKMLLSESAIPGTFDISEFPLDETGFGYKYDTSFISRVTFAGKRLWDSGLGSIDARLKWNEIKQQILSKYFL